MSIKIVKYNLLKEAVDSQLPVAAPNEEIVLVCCRKLKNGKFELEFAQARQLRSSKTDVAAILNESDDRFTTNTKTIFRSWMSVEKGDVLKAFKVDLSAHFEAADKAAADERIMVMMSMKTIYVGDVARRLYLRVIETTNVKRIIKKFLELNDFHEFNLKKFELIYKNVKTSKYETLVSKKGKIIYQIPIISHFGSGDSIDDSVIKHKFFNSEYIDPDKRLENLRLINDNKIKIINKKTYSNSHVYITKSNLKRITNSFKYTSILSCDIYEKEIPFFSEKEIPFFSEKEIPFFSEKEIEDLILIKVFLRDPNSLIQLNFAKITNVDNYKHIFTTDKPAYHKYRNCEALNSNFINYEIPDFILHQGKQKIKEFRSWFKENQYLLNNPEVFEMRFYNKFKVISNIKKVEYSNGGVEIFENLSLFNINEKINRLLKDADDYYNKSSSENKEIISKYAKRTFLAFSDKSIYDNDSNMTDSEIKEFLRNYHFSFKEKTKELLIQKFINESNAELKFDFNLLDELGFKACKKCYNINF